MKEKKEMPFAATRRHQFWTADVRYMETAFNVQRRMADHSFAESESWAKLTAATHRPGQLRRVRLLTLP